MRRRARSWRRQRVARMRASLRSAAARPRSSAVRRRRRRRSWSPPARSCIPLARRRASARSWLCSRVTCPPFHAHSPSPTTHVHACARAHTRTHRQMGAKTGGRRPHKSRLSATRLRVKGLGFRVEDTGRTSEELPWRDSRHKACACCPRHTRLPMPRCRCHFDQYVCARMRGHARSSQGLGCDDKHASKHTPTWRN